MFQKTLERDRLGKDTNYHDKTKAEEASLWYDEFRKMNNGDKMATVTERERECEKTLSVFAPSETTA